MAEETSRIQLPKRWGHARTPAAEVYKENIEGGGEGGGGEEDRQNRQNIEHDSAKWTVVSGWLDKWFAPRNETGAHFSGRAFSHSLNRLEGIGKKW